MKKYFEVTTFRKSELQQVYKLTMSESRLIGQIAKEYDWIKVEVKEMSENDYQLTFA